MADPADRSRTECSWLLKLSQEMRELRGEEADQPANEYDNVLNLLCTGDARLSIAVAWQLEPSWLL
jgi:hypothetical protein